MRLPQLLCKKSHPSHIWNTLKLATASSAPPENWPSFNSNIAGCVVVSYPLCSIINSSTARSLFPTPWKCAIVKPLHKGGHHASPTNYHPISLLSVPSKGFEKHDHIQLSQYLHTHNLLYPLQSGFRPSHSNQTLLLHCLHKWYKALDTKKYVGAVFLDISKALNTVRHELLLSKLTNLGLSSTATSWFRSCLSNRSQIICLLDSYSPRGFPLLGSLRALSLVPLCSLLSSMTVPLFFLSTQLFSLLMIRPSL